MRKLLCLIAVLAISASVATEARASIQAGDVIRVQNAEGGTNGLGGGEYIIEKNLGGKNWSAGLFRTFCLERNEAVAFAVAYTVDSVTTDARNGGVSGQVVPGSDPISAETAYLFYQFTAGTLAGYNYTPNSAGRALTADQLQHAIWVFEGEKNYSNAVYNDPTYVNLANAWAAGASAAEKAFYLSRVRSINPSLNGAVRQSLLYVIPEPATIVVWSALSVLGLVTYRRYAA